MTPEAVQRRIKILLTAQKALLGSVPPNVRAIALDWDTSLITLLFVFETQFTEHDQNNLIQIAKKLEFDFPQDQINAQFLVIPYPQYINSLGEQIIFLRKYTPPKSNTL